MDGVTSLTTTVCVVGCGPAGAMTGLLLARAGVDVVVLEKHADFLRDFRGDTVHPSTLDVLAELGLAERFLALPHHKVPTIGFVTGDRRVDVADFRGLGLRYPYLAIIPQWDFLNLLTAEAARYPTFRLLMTAQAYDVLTESGRVTGVRFRNPDGDHVVRAHVTLAADGRHSAIRDAVGLRPREFGAPMDVVMLRLTRRETDPNEGYQIRMAAGRSIVMINRGSYWNVAYMIRKGGYEALTDARIEALRADLASQFGFLSDRVGELTSFADTRFLEVRVNRLRRWHLPGLLLIGDAAHAMSPIGGVGINLAVQDAVAAANRLTSSLLRAQHTGQAVPESATAAVQRRRWLPTVVTQTLQRLLQRIGIDRALRADAPPPDYARIGTLPLVRPLLGRLIGVGVLPEHVRWR